MQIRRLEFKRFRGFETFTWKPAAGINCLVGPGDAGKSSILDSIALALTPAPAPPAAESDYYRRRVQEGFVVELLIGALTDPVKASFWDLIGGWDAAQGSLSAAPTEGLEEVIQVRLTGTPDLELQHALVTPNGDEAGFSASRRRQLGLCLFRSGRTGGRDFRMTRGSLLERLVGHEELRGLTAQVIRDAAQSVHPPEQVREQLAQLGARFEAAGLGGELSLGLLSPPGANVLAYLGLFVGDHGDELPLAYRGQGTQQLAAFLLARALAREQPIVVLDELEVALEPYRQRQLIRQIRHIIGRTGQAFITTHSPTVIDELDVAELVRIHPAPSSETQERAHHFDNPIDRLKNNDPEALLCRLPVVCEGVTEVGFLQQALGERAAGAGSSLDALGIRLVDGGGQPQALKVADQLLASGMEIAVFLDEEEKHSGRRSGIKARAACSGQFTAGPCTEMAVAFALSADALEQLLAQPGADGPSPRDRRIHQVTEALGRQARPTVRALIGEYGEEKVRQTFGHIAHRQGWFKSLEGGRSLARVAVAAEGGEALAADVDNFWRQLARRVELERPRVTDGGK